MGIQINGNTNNINAGIGSLSIEDLNELDIVGVATAANFKTGVSNLHSVGLSLSGGQIDVGSNIKIGTAGVVTATSFVGDGSNLTGITQTTINSNTNNYLITGTGTANTLQGEANLTFDGSILSATGSATPPSGTGNNYSLNIFRDGGGGYGYFDVVTSGSNHTGVILRAYHNGTYNKILEHNTSDYTRFYTGGTERLRIKSNGNIVLGSDGTNSELTFSQDGTSGTILYSTTTGFGGYNTFTVNSASFVHKYGSNERLRISSAGNIGIGNRTSSPDNLLHVHTSSGDAVIHVEAAADPKLRLRAHSGESIIQFADASSSTSGEINYVHSGDYLKFRVNASERLRITSDGDVAIGRDTALNNYAAGSTTTQLAVVKDGGAAGSGYHEVAHFTGGTDTNDTGAIVRITQFNNDRGLYIKGGRGTGDQAKAIFGLRNSSNSDSDVMVFHQGGNVTKPSEVGFHATGTSTYNRTSDFVPEFNNEYFDIGGGYNNSNYRFTAPVAGRYFLYFQYLTYPNSDPNYKTFLFRKNGSNSGLYDQGFYRGREGQQGNQTSQQMSTYIQLAENDYVEPYVEMGGGTYYNYMGSGHSHFWGFLVH